MRSIILENKRWVYLSVSMVFVQSLSFIFQNSRMTNKNTYDFVGRGRGHEGLEKMMAAMGTEGMGGMPGWGGSAKSPEEISRKWRR